MVDAFDEIHQQPDRRCLDLLPGCVFSLPFNVHCVPFSADRSVSGVYRSVLIVRYLSVYLSVFIVH